MIRNIIFDLGNVLISWKPDDYLRKEGYSEESRELIMNEIIRSREWLMLDNGDISLEKAADMISGRTTLKTPEIFAVFDLRLKILFPLDRNIKILPGLKKRGYRLYYLSNFPDDIFDDLINRNDFFTLFDGGIISARVRLSKPDPEIFRRLMNIYSLKPEESVFIDDIEANSAGAEKAGIRGIHLKNPDHLGRILEETLNINLS